MGRHGVRSISVGGALVALALAFTASASAGLPRPERQAMDIVGVDAKSTSGAAYAEIRFAGDLEEELGTGRLKKARVTIQLIPETGAPTVITDRKSSKRPDEGRTGTQGRFDVIRNGRGISILVEELTGPVAQIAVTTSGPAGSRARAARGLGGIIDMAQSIVDDLLSQPELEAEIRLIEESVKKNESDLDATEREIDETNEAIGRAERRVNTAETAKAAAKAKARLKKLKEKYDDLLRKRKEIEDLIRAQNRWIDDLRSRLGGGNAAQCSDAADNDGDGKIDAADPGCVGPADNDEADTPIAITCPAPGARTSPFSVIHTPQSNAFTSFALRLASNGQTVLDSPVTGASGGPSPLPGDICGPGMNATYEWVVYTDGTPFSLPDAPPGEHGICVFLDIRNPAASGNPGGQDASLVFAAGTAAAAR